MALSNGLINGFPKWSARIPLGRAIKHRWNSFLPGLYGCCGVTHLDGRGGIFINWVLPAASGFGKADSKSKEKMAKFNLLAQFQRLFSSSGATI